MECADSAHAIAMPYFEFDTSKQLELAKLLPKPFEISVSKNNDAMRAPRKRRRPKAPNPLSVKRKLCRQGEQRAVDTERTGRVRKRKRRRNGSKGATHET